MTPIMLSALLAVEAWARAGKIGPHSKYANQRAESAPDRDQHDRHDRQDLHPNRGLRSGAVPGAIDLHRRIWVGE